MLLTLGEVAEQLRCTRRSVERQIAARQLAAIHVGRAVRVERQELEAFIDRLRGCDQPPPERASRGRGM